MKNKIAAVLAALMLLGALTACGTNNASAGNASPGNAYYASFGNASGDNAIG